MTQPAHGHASASRRAPRALWPVLALGALAGCLEPRARYHQTDHQFSWEVEEDAARDRSGLIYVQPPKAEYGSRQQ